MRKYYLNLSLIFYPANGQVWTIDTINDRIERAWFPYSIDIINDNLIVKKDSERKEYKIKLTDDQYLEIKKMVSALTQKYDWSYNFAYDAWGCILIVDNQIYYQNNFFIDYPWPKKRVGHPNLLSTPKEIKLLIDYIVGLSPIPIELGSFV
jgi:hypothetical protein